MPEHPISRDIFSKLENGKVCIIFQKVLKGHKCACVSFPFLLLWAVLHSEQQPVSPGQLFSNLLMCLNPRHPTKRSLIQGVPGGA